MSTAIEYHSMNAGSRPPSLSRSALGFEQAAQNAFAFLAPEYGMRVVESQPLFVRYENDALFVNISHGRSSYELVFEVGRKDQPEDRQVPFGPAEFASLTDPIGAKGLRAFMATTSEEVLHGLSYLAIQFRATTAEALENPELFERLKKQRREAHDEFADGLHERQTRPKAEEAFRQRDYQKAAELYGSMESRLTPAERQKLKIARDRGK